MNWLIPLLTFALGLSVSAVLFLGWHVVRPDRRDGRRSARVRETDPAAADSSVNRTPATHAIRTPAQIGFENPRRAFHSAFLSGDTEAAIALLPDLAHLLGRRQEFLLAASALASAGREEALPYLLDAIRSDRTFDDEQLQGLVGGIVQYYVSMDREEDGLKDVGEIIRTHAYDKSRSKRCRAFVANQLQMLYFGSGRLNDALSTIRYVIELSPEDSSYHFNSSLVLEQLDKLDDAVDAIERCIALETQPDRSHRLQALDLYRKLGNSVKEKQVLAELAR